MGDDLIRDDFLEKHPEAREMRYPLGTFKQVTQVICTLDRPFLESVKANLYNLIYAFREELVDTTFERDGKRYRISSVEFSNDNSILAYAWEVE